MSYGLRVWDSSGVVVFDSTTDYLPLIVAQGVISTPYRGADYDSPDRIYINIPTANRMVIARMKARWSSNYTALQYRTEANRFVLQYPYMNGDTIYYTVLEF